MVNSQTYAAFTQLVLQHYEITLIGPKALGELTGRCAVGAGVTLGILGWERVLPNTHYGGALWEKKGSEKDLLIGAATKMFRRWKRRNEEQ